MVPKSEYAKVFANNLRRIMHERGKNGADMARYLGVGKSRGSYLPAAGVEPARSRMFIELVWNRAKFRVKSL